VGSYDPDAGPAFVSGDGSAPNGLDAYIEDNRGLAVQLVTLSCAGDCATVQAVGVGGNPPYTFAWEDGSTRATRQVCPSSSTRYSVKVTDTGSTGELARAPQTAGAQVTADVLTCPSPDAGGDSGTCAGGLQNLSLEGTPTSGALTLWNLPSWQQCGTPYGGPPEVLNASVPFFLLNAYPPAPADGSTYVGIQVSYVCNGGLCPGGVGQTLCSPIGAGQSQSYRLDARMLPTSDAGPNSAELQIFGGDTACCGDTTCSGAPLLWTSPPLTTSWATYCATLRPAQATPSLTFFGATTPATGNIAILLDKIVPVAACP
jgi:hypothetical protein